MTEGFISDVFPLVNSWLLIVSLLLAGLSVYCSYSGRHKWSLAGLFFAAFFVRLFMAHVDPFLHDWDERFHALVARNMMHDPFRPMLRVTDWVPYDYRLWSDNHIWLHKQPLFMWQMALSMKIFGVSEFAIRYSAVVMGSIGVLMIYRISFLATANRQVAFIAALLTCFSYFPLELMSGHLGMDQNDTAFSFYALASMWAYAEYFDKRTVRYALLTGLFAGCAILVKWLPGLLVFSGWAIILLSNFTKETFKSQMAHFLLAMFICTVVALPWQLYVLHAFPEEATYEFSQYTIRLHEAYQGYTGTWLFYISRFDLYYGNYISYLLPAGIAILLFDKKYRTPLSLVLLFLFSVSFFFFSFISKTMVPGYFMLAQPIGNIFIAIAIFRFIGSPNVFKYLYIPVLLIVAMVAFDLSEITRQHDPRHWADWKIRSHNEEVYKHLRNYLPERVKLVVNAKDAINIMFYNNDVDAYGWFPEREYQEVKEKHIPVGILQMPEHGIYSFMLPYDSAFVMPAVIE
jgi:4-amino-4-deoxy-L-arabinose transferase-like glycosyltransferase